MIKKNTYQAKTYDEAVNQALADLMDIQGLSLSSI